MIVLIDVGNSNIVLSQYQNNKLSETYRYTTDKSKTADEYYVILKPVIEQAKDAIISSVVPELNEIFKSLFEKYYHLTPTFVSPGIKTGVKVKVDNPKEVGADLVSAAAGAIDQYGDDVIVIDMGTATTLTYIKNRVITGVAIMAGLVSQRDCLVSGASQLSQFEFKKPKSVLATNTIDCLNSGLLYGHITMLEGMIKRVKEEYHTNAPVLITGGASRFLTPILNSDIHYEPALILNGLIKIYQKNK
ncbi:MAG: type III pantothenate kinase [Candidatus Izimaplasma sp.]|nr:type III pantothenate kinase [Candidatus Izimaplasma bacterium]